MVSTQYFEDVIKKSGLKKGFIAEKCGITTQTFTNKILNKSEFTASEIKIISKVLGLSPKTLKDIFFADDVHTNMDKEG